MNFFLKVEGVDVGEVVSLQKAISSNGDSAIKPSPLDLHYKAEGCEDCRSIFGAGILQYLGNMLSGTSTEQKHAQ